MQTKRLKRNSFFRNIFSILTILGYRKRIHALFFIIFGSSLNADVIDIGNRAFVPLPQPHSIMPETSLETASSYDTQDPFEPLNRVIFDFNYWLDKLILLNIAKIYLSVTPPPLQEGISNALYTLTLPITTLNHLLQGNIEDASDSFGTFLFNMVFGLFGFVDIAQSTGMKKTFNDFGKTFSFMGVPSGPYLMLPVYGPTNPRDLCGTVLDWISSPFNIICRHSHSNAPYAATSLNMVSRRANNINFLDRIERESFDLYITVRSLYTQSRSTVEDTLEEGPRPFAWDAQEDLL